MSLPVVLVAEAFCPPLTSTMSEPDPGVVLGERVAALIGWGDSISESDGSLIGTGLMRMTTKSPIPCPDVVLQELDVVVVDCTLHRWGAFNQAASRLQQRVGIVPRVYNSHMHCTCHPQGQEAVDLDEDSCLYVRPLFFKLTVEDVVRYRHIQDFACL